MTQLRKAPKRKASILGVHPVLAAVAALALVFAGVVAGAWVNVASQPSKPPVRAAAPARPLKPAPDVRVPPRVANIEQIEAEAPAEGPPLTPQLMGKAPTVAPGAKEQAGGEDDPVFAYAVPYAGSENTPVIAIVIDDLGVDRARALKTVELPGPLTLSFMTYAGDLPGWVDRARRGGHEIMAHVPMEPRDPKENPGPKALTLSMSPNTVAERLAEVLDPWSGYVGINNHMGSRFTADKVRMGVVMAGLKARGLLWLDSKTAGDSVGAELARAAGVPTVERDIFIDNVQTDSEVRRELAHAEEIARTRGSAIAIGHPHDVTTKVLRQWIAGLPERGLALAPLTEVARRRGQLKDAGF